MEICESCKERMSHVTNDDGSEMLLCGYCGHEEYFLYDPEDDEK